MKYVPIVKKALNKYNIILSLGLFEAELCIAVIILSSLGKVKLYFP